MHLLLSGYVGRVNQRFVVSLTLSWHIKLFMNWLRLLILFQLKCNSLVLSLSWIITAALLCFMPLCKGIMKDVKWSLRCTMRTQRIITREKKRCLINLVAPLSQEQWLSVNKAFVMLCVFNLDLWFLISLVMKMKEKCYDCMHGRKTQKYMLSKGLLRHDVVRVFVSSLVLVFVRAILSWCP